jgi:hypothetical protein
MLSLNPTTIQCASATGFGFRQGQRIFLTFIASGPALEPTQLVFNVYRLKRLGRGTKHQLSSNAQANCYRNCATWRAHTVL